MVAFFLFFAKSFVGAQAIGPLPYLKRADSPFSSVDFTGGYFYLEDFEDGSLDTPQVTASSGHISPPGPFTDSVDEDDGAIDGSGNNGHSWVSVDGETPVIFTFCEPLPTHAGIVWTDGINDITVTFTGGGGTQTLVGSHADGSFGGGTVEDRFYGLIDPEGITSIKIVGGFGQGWEVDHLQYGFSCPPGNCKDADSGVCGSKYYDLNRNGKRDPGEPGIPDWQIYAEDTVCNVVRLGTTDWSGNYRIPTCRGRVIVTEQEPLGWARTAPASGSYNVTVAGEAFAMGLDFGNYMRDPCPPRNLEMDLSTGIDAAGAQLPEGTPSGGPWLVLHDQLASTVKPHLPVVATPDASWASMPGSAWVSTSYAAGTQPAPSGVYEYQACFCLDPRFHDASLTLQLLTDNQAGVYLNNFLIGTTPQNSFLGPPTVINAAAPNLFQPGENCIRIVVVHDAGPTALNVSGALMAVEGMCCDAEAGCTITCPECAIPEPEQTCGPGYVDAVNPGCSGGSPLFTPVQCGDTVCGHAGTFDSAGSLARDEDWYEVIQERACDLIWRITAEFPAEALIIDGASGCPGNVLASALAPGCGEIVVEALNVPPGPYWLVVRPQAMAMVPCDAAYIAKLVCCRNCDDEEAQYDDHGNLVLPSDYDPSQPITEEEGETDNGYVDQLYPGYDTSLDVWYPCYPCDPSIGGDLPDAPDLDQELEKAGITGATAQEIAATLDGWEEQIGDTYAGEADRLATASPASGAYSHPTAPHCTPLGCRYVFGGRDLVFVHGLRLSPLKDKLLNLDPAASITWNSPSSFPGLKENPEFYDLRPTGGKYGYWKKGADQYWQEHIRRFLHDRGIMNRYLIVAFPATDRFEVGIQAILTQIADAMRFGVGVIDPLNPVDPATGKPSGPPPTDFGTPSFVIVSHSTGGIVTSSAMSAAANNANLNAGFIPAHCKAHIALHSVFSGSRMATAAVVLGGAVKVIGAIPQWVCKFVEQTLFATDKQLANENCTLLKSSAVLKSNLIDLVPAVAQLKWHKYVNTSPVRTLTVVSGHPTYFFPFKSLLHPGYDDGVSSMNSQAAMPSFTLFWPSLLHVPLSKKVPGLPVPVPLNPPLHWIPLYDMGVSKKHDTGITNPESQPLRAAFLFVDQVIDRRIGVKLFGVPLVVPLGARLCPLAAASAATPYVSPTGMLEPPVSTKICPLKIPLPKVVQALIDKQFDPLRRLNNHYSFIQSTAGHFDSTPSYDDPAPFVLYPHYRQSFGETNAEETRVLTSDDVYKPFAMPYSPLLDSQPLLTPACTPQVKELTRYNRHRIPRKQGKPPKYLYIWKRTYHLLEDWQTKHECDYVYDSVLCELVNPCPFEPAYDCNHNEIDDRCEIATSAVSDCNRNGIPDSCDIAGGTASDKNGNGVPDECEPPRFRRGDVDGNGSLVINDAILILGWLFLGESEPGCLDAADANDDSSVDISDPLAILQFLFLGGFVPPPPGPFACGADSTPDGLPDCQGGC